MADTMSERIELAEEVVRHTKECVATRTVRAALGARAAGIDAMLDRVVVADVAEGRLVPVEEPGERVPVVMVDEFEAVRSDLTAPLQDQSDAAGQDLRLMTLLERRPSLEVLPEDFGHEIRAMIRGQTLGKTVASTLTLFVDDEHSASAIKLHGRPHVLVRQGRPLPCYAATLAHELSHAQYFIEHPVVAADEASVDAYALSLELLGYVNQIPLYGENLRDFNEADFALRIQATLALARVDLEASNLTLPGDIKSRLQAAGLPKFW